MASKDVSTDKSSNPQKVVIRDLDKLISKSLNEKISVVNFTTSLLLSKGENYGSTMIKLNVVIKRGKDGVEENLSLVAKMLPESDFQTDQLNSTNSFIKEIYVFEKLIPAYKELEKEMGMSDDELFDELPKFYGGRLTINEQNHNEADEDAILLMENLMVHKYQTMDRMQGLDLNHAKVAVATLARFHALGTALKLKKPLLFEEALKPLSTCPFKRIDVICEVSDHIFKTVCSDPRIAKYKDRIEPVKGLLWEFVMREHEDGPWTSIIHGDYWVNNIMFREENGKIKGIKLVDFQFTMVWNALRDLPYFLCGSVKPDVLHNHFDQLVDIYYEKYVEVLARTGCDTKPYTRKSFEENLKKEAHTELFHCLLAIKFFTASVSEDTDLNDLKEKVLMVDSNSLFAERSWKVISLFVEKNWI